MKSVATLNIYVTKDVKPWVHEGKAFDPVDSHGGAGLITRVVNQLNNIGRDADKLQQKLEEKETELRAVNKRLGIPFPDEQDLIAKEEEVRRLQADLAATGTAVPGPDALADLVAGLNAEKTATTMRTGPTYATAMRQPLVAGARNRMKEVQGMARPPLVRLKGRDGTVTYPKTSKGSDGKWQISSPDVGKGSSEGSGGTPSSSSPKS